MRYLKNILVTSFVLSCVLVTAQIPDAKYDMDTFVRTWKIDLRPTYDSEPYFQDFVVNGLEENTFQGTFYGSEIQDGLINKNWDRLYFSFSTSDATHTYYHSGYYKEDHVHGITYCPTRTLVARWRGNLEDIEE